MKFILIVFLTTSCFAGFWQTEENIEKFLNNTLDNWVEYKRKGSCQSKEGKICYDINAQNMAYFRLTPIQVDDHSKPIFASYMDQIECFIKEYELLEGLADDDCRSMTARQNVGTFENPIYEYPLCTDKTYYAMYIDNLDGTYSAQCTKLIGYTQKWVKAFREDAVLKASWEAKKAEKEVEKQTKEAAKLLLKGKKGKIDKLSKDEVNELLEAILLHLGL